MQHMMTSSTGMGGHMERAVAAVWLLLVVKLGLSASALAKHLFSKR